MKLYWAPHTCAIGIHVLLEEIGAPYETEQLNLERGDNRRPPFINLNPKGKVPTLEFDDGTVLTEFGAIAMWLARANPQAELLPADAMVQARALEVLEYVEGTIHGQGYARMIAPQAFATTDAVDADGRMEEERIVLRGKQIVEEGFAILDTHLKRHRFAVGNQLSIADSALFYVERWAPAKGITLPINVEAHFQQMLARPAVRKVMHLWGER